MDVKHHQNSFVVVVLFLREMILVIQSNKSVVSPDFFSTKLFCNSVSVLRRHCTQRSCWLYVQYLQKMQAKKERAVQRQKRMEQEEAEEEAARKKTVEQRRRVGAALIELLASYPR